MPQCHRCQRVQATCELRRTTLGYLCRENGKGTRCAALTHELRRALAGWRHARSVEAAV